MLKKKIFFYTKHQQKGASSRYRSLQYFDLVSDNGYEIAHRYLFSDKYLVNKYKGNKISYLFIALVNYVSRVFNLIVDIRPGNVFFIEKELFPYVPFALESILRFFKVKYIVDFDDAIWHNYDSSKNKWVRLFLANKLKGVIKGSDFFIGGNDYLCDYAHRCGAKNILNLPTVTSLKVYNESFIGVKKEDITTIVWIGSPSTSPYILMLNDVLTGLSEKYSVAVKLIGFDRSLSNSLTFNHSIVDWDPNTEVMEMAKSHIGIMPLPDKPFEKGKCGFKLIQYMAVGLPVLASPVGVNEKIVKSNINGYICDSNSDWYDRLEELILDNNKMQSMGAESRIIYVEKYSLEANAPLLLSVLNRVSGH